MLSQIKYQILNIFDSNFEFVSPLTSDECAKRLRDKHQPTRFFRVSSPLKVSIVNQSDGSYKFMLQRDAGRNLVVELIGTLETMPDDSTCVSGTGQASPYTMFVLVFISVIQFIVLGATWNALPSHLFIVAIIAAFWIAIAEERQRLLSVLVNTLGSLDGKKKKRGDQ